MATVLSNYFLAFLKRTSELKRLWLCAFVLVIMAFFIQPYPVLAGIFGFSLAAYAAVSNDSIQTLGTFLSSNKERSWTQQWLWIGGIYLLTVLYSWYTFDGDVTYQRLAMKELSADPTEFNMVMLLAPIVLILLTAYRIPVSTTLLLLTCFLSEMSGLEKILTKSMAGYAIAFFAATLIWLVASAISHKTPLRRWLVESEPGPWWRGFQWLTTATLWHLWLAQDMSNIAVYLPRSMNIWYLALVLLIPFFGLGYMIRNGGDEIQKIVDVKSDVTDTRSACLIDCSYAVILFYFKGYNHIPMSTTFVFLGLLAGREVGYLLWKLYTNNDHSKVQTVLRLIGEDGGRLATGLVSAVMIGGIAHWT